MNQFLSTLRFTALFLTIAATAAHATPGTITPEQGEGDQIQQGQRDNGDDGYLEDDTEQDQDDGYQDDQGQDEQGQDDGYLPDDQQQGDDGYQSGDQNQGDDWGDDQGDKGKNQDRDQGKNGKGDDRDQGRNERPNRPGKYPGKRHHKPDYGKRPRVINVPVQRQFFGMARLPLYMLTNDLMRLEGYRLVGITLNGSSDAGMGGAFFCSSACGPMQNVGYYIGSYPIQTLGERVNPASGQWFLELRGNFWVDSIQLQFAR